MTALEGEAGADGPGLNAVGDRPEIGEIFRAIAPDGHGANALGVFVLDPHGLVA